MPDEDEANTGQTAVDWPAGNLLTTLRLEALSLANDCSKDADEVVERAKAYEKFLTRKPDGS